MSEAELVLTDECFGDYLKLIHQLTGITVMSNRKSMLQSRLRKHILSIGQSSYENYLRLVQSSAPEKVVFIDLVTTNETYFYRTPRIWDYIEKKFLPAWHQSHPRQTLQAWSAAASSGEEAHSLAVSCQIFKEKHPDFSFQILGTDISQEMVELCQAGEYAGRSIESFRRLRPDAFQKYMIPHREGFRAAPEIRSRLKFQQHNLFGSLKSPVKFDLVLLRNVLIYFTPQDQEKVLAGLRPSLRPSGVLIIGESESLTHIHSDFKAVEPLVYLNPAFEAA